MTLDSNLRALASAIGADMKARIAAGAVKTSDVQAALGLSAGSGTVNVTTRALTGVTGPWEDATDTVPYVFGTRFTANADGTVSSLRIYLTTRQYDGRTLTVGLYSDAGALLRQGTKTVSAGDAIGWVDVPLASSVAATKGTAYKAVMHCPLANDNSAHFAKIYAGWANHAPNGVVIASSVGGNGWSSYNATSIRNADTADTANQNMFGIDVNLVTAQPSANSGARLPVVAYYDDSNYATAARPTSDPLVAVLWFNSTGVRYPTNALSAVDKVWTL